MHTRVKNGEVVIISLIVALMGIGGTLASAFMVQRNTNRLREIELRQANEVRMEERSHAEKNAGLESRRACYVSLNIAARLYQTQLTNLLVALQGELTSDEIRGNVEEARKEHRARHAEAQMVVPDEVLTHAGKVNSHLGNFYGVLRRLDLGTSASGETLELAEEMRSEVWKEIADMRHAMRRDLGITT
ncbi:hypothetical protein ACOZFM_23365 [Streptomyces arboris]|uniref:hypothetical protein n=1 Tax=Streptomyces arboris TaxID=2600619 RepID=UPI003BF531CA